MPPPLQWPDQEFLQRHTWPWGPSLAEKDALRTPSRGHRVAPRTPRVLRRGQKRALPLRRSAGAGADCRLLSWGDSARQGRPGQAGDESLPLHHQDAVMSPGTRGGDGRWVGLGTSACAEPSCSRRQHQPTWSGAPTAAAGASAHPWGLLSTPDSCSCGPAAASNPHVSSQDGAEAGPLLDTFQTNMTSPCFLLAQPRLPDALQAGAAG